MITLTSAMQIQKLAGKTFLATSKKTESGPSCNSDLQQIKILKKKEPKELTQGSISLASTNRSSKSMEREAVIEVETRETKEKENKRARFRKRAYRRKKSMQGI